MCREQALELAALFARLRTDGIMLRLIGVMHNDENADSFRPFFPGGELVMDPRRRVYGALGNLQLPPLVGFLSPTAWRNISRAQDLGVPVDFDSDSTSSEHLGGVMVVAEGDRGILYQFKEKVRSAAFHLSQTLVPLFFIIVLHVQAYRHTVTRRRSTMSSSHVACWTGSGGRGATRSP